MEKFSSNRLMVEAAAVVHHAGVTVTGPDTPEHLHDFTMDAVLSDIETHAPHLLETVMKVARTDRNTAPGTGEDDSKSVESIKALTAICALILQRQKECNY